MNGERLRTRALGVPPSQRDGEHAALASGIVFDVFEHAESRTANEGLQARPGSRLASGPDAPPDPGSIGRQPAGRGRRRGQKVRSVGGVCAARNARAAFQTDGPGRTVERGFVDVVWLHVPEFINGASPHRPAPTDLSLRCSWF